MILNIIERYLNNVAVYASFLREIYLYSLFYGKTGREAPFFEKI